MLSYIDGLVRLEALIWLLPVAFFIHDGEEIGTMERWLRKAKENPRITFENRLLNPDKNITIQFTVAVLLLGLVLTVVAALTAERFQTDGQLNLLFIGIVAVMLGDGVKHLGISLALRSYSAGVATALFIEIPYGAYALYRFWDAGLAGPVTILKSTALVLPLVLSLVWLGLTLGSRITPYRRHA
ncbi:HXXEE domain-containing protein [Paenibacillus donghaensis]|uniref:HXXEE domain-containing protein n=1 Tax=Paenibacillus donghaensis TaxID=414771 RepID=A0A2Z2K6G4_9BACL|nr:HXXEE domain-containing protein [Paenibacillus donghaensis]ASA20414.1 hypothetical protein B9T62_06115 [Paenibacillus donghaensis]